MLTRGGINTVEIDSEFVHITDLPAEILCREWTKRQREIHALYDANRRANIGWRGILLRAIGINLSYKSPSA